MVVSIKTWIKIKKSIFLSITVLIMLLIITLIKPLPVIISQVSLQDEHTENNIIQYLLDDADEDDIIIINSGYYAENIVISKPITLRGERTNNTIIDGKGNTTITIRSENVTISNITIINADLGVYIGNSTTVHVTNNTFYNCTIGIYCGLKSKKNLIYSNNFVNNKIHAIDYSSQNNWNSEIMGNYWDDYTGTDTNNIGIGDTPYNITKNASDLFPLMHPVTTPPIADFYISPTNPTIETMISFTDFSIKTDNQIISWKWDFGDKNTSTEQNTTYQYDQNGLYLVSLTVTDILGATDTQTYSLIIQNLPPTASFTVTPETPMTTEEVNFMDTSIDKDGYIVNRTWNVNDSFYEYASSFQHTFIEKGIYTVTLTVTDNDNASSTIIKQITVVNTPPTANFFYISKNDTYMIGSPVEFKDNSFDQDGVIVSYHWDFNDKTTSTEKNPTHIFSSTGRHQVTLTVTDNDGDQDTITRSILIGTNNDDEGFLLALSFFDILMVIVILSAVILVLIVSKKYSSGGY